MHNISDIHSALVQRLVMRRVSKERERERERKREIYSGKKYRHCHVISRCTTRPSRQLIFSDGKPLLYIPNEIQRRAKGACTEKGEKKMDLFTLKRFVPFRGGRLCGDKWVVVISSA